MQLLSVATKSDNSAQGCALELLDALPPLMRVVRKYMRSHRAHGLSVPQFRAMAFLRTTPAAKLSAVAEFLGASMSTTSRIVSGLVNKGLVRRDERCADRRCVDLALTPRGVSVTDKARRATQSQLARELEALTEDERQAVLLGMQLLRSLFAPRMRLTKENGTTDEHG
jgi:DNA-binding MarR family transcriptional regulator